MTMAEITPAQNLVELSPLVKFESYYLTHALLDGPFKVISISARNTIKERPLLCPKKKPSTTPPSFARNSSERLRESFEAKAPELS